MHPLVREAEQVERNLLEVVQRLAVDALHDEEAYDARVVVDVEAARLAHRLEHPDATARRLHRAQLQQLRAHRLVRRALPAQQPLVVLEGAVDRAGLDLGLQVRLEHRHRHERRVGRRRAAAHG
eukprot:4323408-Prymnesium_polylepis.1